VLAQALISSFAGALRRKTDGTDVTGRAAYGKPEYFNLRSHVILLYYRLCSLPRFKNLVLTDDLANPAICMEIFL
jgi:hypothetical protein